MLHRGLWSRGRGRGAGWLNCCASPRRSMEAHAAVHVSEPGVPVDEQQDYAELATGLAAMARELLAQDSVQTTLDSIAAHAVKLVNGCEAAGIIDRKSVV